MNKAGTCTKQKGLTIEQTNKKFKWKQKLKETRATDDTFKSHTQQQPNKVGGHETKTEIKWEIVGTI